MGDATHRDPIRTADRTVLFTVVSAVFMPISMDPTGCPRILRRSTQFRDPLCEWRSVVKVSFSTLFFLHYDPLAITAIQIRMLSNVHC
jgi:hypothetical protein